MFYSKINIPFYHFTAVCLVTWPLIGSKAGDDFLLIRTSLFFIISYDVNHAVLMVTCLHLQAVRFVLNQSTISPPSEKRHPEKAPLKIKTCSSQDAEQVVSSALWNLRFFFARLTIRFSSRRRFNTRWTLLR